MQKIYVNPYWNPTKVSENILINETANLDSGVTWVDPYSYFMRVTLSTSGLSSVDDYYRNWIIHKKGTSQYANVVSYVVSGTTAEIHTLQDIGTRLLWTATVDNGGSSAYELFRNFHSSLSGDSPTQFSPTYNNSLTDPPVVISDNSVVFLSGGQSPNSGNRGMMFYPRLNKTFFPDVTVGVSKGYAFLGSYAEEEELKSYNPIPHYPTSTDAAYAILSYEPTVSPLTTGKTYWFAVAPVYEGNQVGKLQKFDDSSLYSCGNTGAAWSHNYLSSGTGGLNVRFDFDLATMDKRLIGVLPCLAVDTGDTSSSGRVNPYFPVGFFSIVDSSYPETGVLWNATSQVFRIEIRYSQASVDLALAGTTYQSYAGIIEVPPDTSYAYSMRAVHGGRHYISNVYIASNGTVDRQNLFTNAVGGGAINSGISAVNVFSNEEGIYRLRVEPTVGTKINAIIPTGINELLIVKDRGLIHARPVDIGGGMVDLQTRIMSRTVGCSTINQARTSDDGWTYFAGYDDIYRANESTFEKLIERPDLNDWLYTYREIITKTQKEACVTWVLPQNIIYFDIGQTLGYQYSFYPRYDWHENRESLNGWRPCAFQCTSGFLSGKFFKWTTQLQGGTILAITTDGDIVQFTNPTTGMFYYDDAGTPIRYQIDTGNFLPAGTETKDFILNKIVVAKDYDVVPTGTIDASIYMDGSLLKTESGLQKATPYLQIHATINQQKRANNWRLAYNTNNGSPEVMAATSRILVVHGIHWFGTPVMRKARVDESSSPTIVSGGGVQNTINGVRWLIIPVAGIDTPYTWDKPYTKTEVNYASTPEADFRLSLDSAHPLVSGIEDVSTNAEVTIVSRSLTGIVLRSNIDQTLVRFSTE